MIYNYVLFAGPYPQLTKLINLPTPRVLDTQRLVANVMLKQSINNTKRTYVRQHRADEVELNLAFRFVSRSKEEQLLSFYNEFVDRFFRYTDYTGAHWKVRFISDYNFTMTNRTDPCVPGRTESGEINIVLRGSKLSA